MNTEEVRGNASDRGEMERQEFCHRRRGRSARLCMGGNRNDPFVQKRDIVKGKREDDAHSGRVTITDTMLLQEFVVV